jgi:hypothetical protein
MSEETTRHRRKRAAILMLTNWSTVTNGLFVVCGVILAALGSSSEATGQEKP